MFLYSCTNLKKKNTFIVWKVFSNFATTKEGGKWVIESDAFFIQHTGKLNSSTMELGKEVKVEFPWNLKIGDILKGDETKRLKLLISFL